jgi:hypothetical protein
VVAGDPGERRRAGFVDRERRFADRVTGALPGFAAPIFF